MGFLDKVRSVLTGSDAQRARSAGEAVEPVQAEAEAAGDEVPEQAPDVASRGRARGSAPENRTHTVQRGDTLAAIAEHYGVDPHAMAELNGLDNPDLIYPGQVFKVPDA